MTKKTRDNTDYPALYKSASIASKNAQRNYYFGIAFILLSLLLASIFSLFSGSCKIFAILSTCSLSLAPLVSLFLIVKRFDKTWYTARSIAETIKTITWRYMTRAQPYNKDDANDLFRTSLRKILRENKECCKHFPPAQTDQITEYMSTVRSSSLSNRRALYLNERIENQREWYKGNVNYNKKRATIWVILMVVFQIGAIIFSVLKIYHQNWDYLPTEIFAAAAASVLAWIQAKRFQELSTSYAITTHDISIVKSEYSEIISEQQFSDFVGDAESAFSREHTQWRARRDT